MAQGKPETTVVLVLGDQLTHTLSSLVGVEQATTVVLLCEVHDEATYVRHHKKKIAFLFSAMRHFAAELRARGWQVDYVKLDAPSNTGSFVGEVERAIARHKVARIRVTEPGEWRLREEFERWEARFGLPVEILEDDRFLASRAEFAAFAKARKSLRMEYFYREMRKRTGLLMDGNEPEGGRWNFDHDNRKPAGAELAMPPVPRFEPDPETRDVLALVEQRFGNHFGDLEPFWFGVTAQDAEAAFAHFLDHGLPHFGDFQDAMLKGEKFLYHSVTSLYLNAGLLDPLEMCRAAERRYRDGLAPLNAVEGFIRQIIGWREYVRGIYWLKMPDYADQNFLRASRNLPDFYWTGETDMVCLAEAIRQTREEAYAHHIQRLMVTGNFAMLIGVEPKQINDWYLIVYADAYEWVEMPNVIGMSQFADGGLLGSKPYAASGAYINRMSNYCSSCRYDVKLKTGSKACPFNALYWDFLDRNRAQLGTNPRLGTVYSSWDRMGPDKQDAYRDSARAFLATL
ncbi:MAG: cryptochrome/photolyase family protein [Hyphomicrobiaceae bacterium]